MCHDIAPNKASARKPLKMSEREVFLLLNRLVATTRKATMRFLTIIFSLFAVFALCSAQASILDDLNQYPDLSILVSLLRATGLDQVLGDINGPQYTLFAPNNTAFKALPPTILKALPGNVELLKSVLLYHVSTKIDLDLNLDLY